MVHFSGELYVIVEYCHHGNLRSYLINHKEEFCNIMEDYINGALEKKYETAANKSYYINNAHIGNIADFAEPPLTTNKLISWSFQVARGMEYLASKRVRLMLPCRAGHRVSGSKNGKVRINEKCQDSIN
jgi:serine/threonine protein kinase